MSLNWNAEKVKYFEDNPDDLYIHIKTEMDDYWDVNAETKSLIFGSMIVGLGSITESNIPDWYARWKVLEKLENYYLYYKVLDSEYEYVYISIPILEKHVGLCMNVSNEKEAGWCSRMAKHKFLNGNQYTANQIRSLVTVNKMEFDDLMKKREIEVMS